MSGKRSLVRRDVELLTGVDRDSVSDGPGWLWSGTLNAPIRAQDLSPRLRQRIPASNAGDLRPALAKLAQQKPRSAHPRAVRATWLAAAAAVGATAAWLGSTNLDSDLGRRLLLVAMVAVGGAAVVAIAAQVLSRRTRVSGPRLSGSEASELRDVVRDRSLTWTPLAGDGEVSAGAAMALCAYRLIAELHAHPGWELPEVAVSCLPPDGAEEMFQIARGCARLDELLGYAHSVKGYPEAAGTRDACLAEADELREVLFSRLTTLRSCADELEILIRREQGAKLAIAAPDEDHAYVDVTSLEFANQHLDLLRESLAALTPMSRS